MPARPTGRDAPLRDDDAAARLLAETGVATLEQLHAARTLAAARHVPLVEALLHLESEGSPAVEETAVLRAFATAAGTRFVRAAKLAEATVPDAVLEAVPARAAEQLGAVPLRLSGGELHAVVAAPIPDDASAELALVTGVSRVHLYVSTPGGVAAAIRKLYFRDDDAFARLGSNGQAPLPEPPKPAPVEKPEQSRTRVVFRDDHEALVSLRQENARYRIAQEFLSRVSLAADAAVLLDNILEVVFDLLPADAVAILARDQVRTRTRERGKPFEVPLRVLTQVLDQPDGALIDDAFVDERLSGSESVLVRGVRCAMAVPLRSGARVHGVLYLDSVSAPFAFGPSDLGMLQAIAAQAALLLDNFELLDATRRDAETRSALARFLPPGLVEQAAQGRLPIRPEGRAATAAVLFADIRGFTGLASGLPATEVVATLNQFFAAMTDAVHEHGGAVDKLIGDAVMAVWGVPVAGPDDPARALAAALSMVERARAIRAGGRPLEIGVGVDAGEVVHGAIGSPRRLDYTSIGSPVNLASRLAALAGPGEVLATRHVVEAAGPAVEAIAGAPEAVKGFSAPIVPFRVRRR